MKSLESRIVVVLILYGVLISGFKHMNVGSDRMRNRFNIFYEVRKIEEKPWNSWDDKPLRNIYSHNTSYPYDHNHVFETRLVKVNDICAHC